MIDRQDKFVPGAALRGEEFAAGGRQAVKPTPALSGLFHPAAGDQASIFEAAENGIERADAELDASFGARFDELTDLIAVARARLDQKENQEFGAAFLEFTVEHTAAQYTSVKSMSRTDSTHCLTAAKRATMSSAENKAYANAKRLPWARPAQ